MADGVSVQGNTLANENVLKAVYDTVMSARKSGLNIRETLMKALLAGSEAGGDKRCGEQKASSAFITVMRPGDDPKKNLISISLSPVLKVVPMQ